MVYNSIIGITMILSYKHVMWLTKPFFFFFFWNFRKLQIRVNDQRSWSDPRPTYLISDLNRHGGSQEGSFVCWSFAEVFSQKYNLLQVLCTNQIFVWKYKLLWSQRLQIFFSFLSKCVKLQHLCFKCEQRKMLAFTLTHTPTRGENLKMKKSFAVEFWCFSKCQRGFNGFSKLPGGKEIDVIRWI